MADPNWQVGLPELVQSYYLPSPTNGYYLGWSGSGGGATLQNIAPPSPLPQDVTATWCGIAGGSGNAITLAPSPAIVAYAAGMVFRFVASSANTSTTTVNVSGLGAIALQLNATALVGGEVVIGNLYEIVYDGTQFQITAGWQKSSYVEFTQSGSGAAKRDVQDKERDIVSVFDFAFTTAQKADIRTRAAAIVAGATLTASIAACQALGALAWVPAGTYNMDDGVTATSWAGANIVGAGINNTIFKKTSAGDLMTLTSVSRGTIADIAFDGTGMPSGGGLVLTGADSGVMQIRDLQFANFPGRGIYANFGSGAPASDIDFIHNIVLSCGVTSATPQAEFRYCNDSSWEQNQYGTTTLASPAPLIGAYHYSCQSSDFGPSNYHWNNVVGAKYESCDYGTWLGNRWEECTHEAVQFLSTTRGTITANKWHSNSAASSGTYDGMTLTTCSLMTITANNCFTFNSNQVRYSLNIASDCFSITVNDNVFSGFATRPVQWSRSASFDMKFKGNLPSGYGINQGNPPIYAKAIGVAAGVTTFAGLGASSFTEGDVQMIGPEETIMLTNMRVVLSAAPGAGKSITITARRNAVDTAHTCTISDGNFTGSFVAAVGSESLIGIGESFSWKVVNGAAAATNTVTIAQTTAI